MNVDSIKPDFITNGDGAKKFAVLPVAQFDELEKHLCRLSYEARYQWHSGMKANRWLCTDDGMKTHAIVEYAMWHQTLINAQRWEWEAKDRAEGRAYFVSFNMPRKRLSANAIWYPAQDRLWVISGSQAALYPVDSMHETYVQTRERLVQSGVLRQQGLALEFAKDYQFFSPSEAACVVGGNSRNGCDSWRDAWGRSISRLRRGA